MKMSWNVLIKFIHRNRHWLHTWLQDDFRISSELCRSFFLCKLFNSTVIFAFSSYLFFSRSFVGPSILPYMIKGIAFLGVRWPDVRGDLVTETFWPPKLNSSTYVTWRRILLTDVGYSNNHRLYPGQQYLAVESEAM